METIPLGKNDLQELRLALSCVYHAYIFFLWWEDWDSKED